MDLTVVILNWNTRDLLRDCLAALHAHACSVDYNILVVDNCSEDGSREMVSAEFPEAMLHVTPTNLGFGAGNNVAIPLIRGRYTLFLNSDTIAQNGALESLVQYADTHPDAGVLGPKLLNRDGSLQYSCRHYPNLGTGFFRNTPLGRLFPGNRFTRDYLMLDWDHDSVRNVDWVSGAALMIRTDLLRELQGFDEDFFMYCEDVDLCWRAAHTLWAHAGASSADAMWRVVYVPDARIYHFIGKSSDQVPTRMTYHFHRSQYLFYLKHYRAQTPMLLRAIIPLGIWLRAIGQLVRYRWRWLAQGKWRTANARIKKEPRKAAAASEQDKVH